MRQFETPCEEAAYSYCKIMNLDPDEKIMFNDGTNNLVARYKKRFLVLADEFADLELRMHCIDEAKRFW